MRRSSRRWWTPSTRPSPRSATPSTSTRDGPWRATAGGAGRRCRAGVERQRAAPTASAPLPACRASRRLADEELGLPRRALPAAGSLAVRKSRRNHRRILVVDGRIGFTGGSGVSRKWMGNGRVEGHWRDTGRQGGRAGRRHLQAAFAGELAGGAPAWCSAASGYFPGTAPEPRGKIIRAGRAQLAGRRELRDVHDASCSLAQSSARRSMCTSPTPTCCLDDQDAGDADRPGEAAACA